MANLGKIVNSIFSATNENTIALANLNFDFAILKYEAPKEFQALGTSLSTRRRNEAEDGKTHRIASRLGALFKAIVPVTPNLINAYGTRASQIAASPNANPKQNPKFGPFAEFVGIDGTSLWAAATAAKPNATTHAPLAMYLLACILARRWESTVAVSIWVEIVEKRQEEIESAIQDEPQHISQFMAARHEISRNDLAAWDASARAWLQSADEAKTAERIQLDLIAKNISVKIGSDVRTYHNVIEVWKCAMQGMELLIQGIPQELSDGAVLLALSAWHLYPDLIVLGQTTKKVNFQDPLISAGGTLTVGLHYVNDAQEPGMHWSLTLSHLRYYEKAAKVNARPDMDRVSMKELLVIAFGGLMSCWNVPSSTETAAADLLIQIRIQTLSTRELVDEKDLAPAWLRIVALASQEFLALRNTNEKLCIKLVAWGRRRAKHFLASEDSLPFFGLGNPCLLTALTGTDPHEATFLYFRRLVGTMKNSTKTYIVRYKKQRAMSQYFEFATVIPHNRSTHKREFDGGVRQQAYHQRWLCLVIDRPTSTVCCSCTSCTWSCPCRQESIMVCGNDCHPTAMQNCQGFDVMDKHRSSELKSLGEESQWISSQDILCGSDSESFVWLNVPSMIGSRFCASINMLEKSPTGGTGLPQCSRTASISQQSVHKIDSLCFRVVEGNPETYCLFAASILPESNAGNPQDQNEFGASTGEAKTLQLQNAIASLKEKSLNKKMFYEYLHYYDVTDPELLEISDMMPPQWETSPDAIAIWGGKQRMSSVQGRALRALNFAQRLYEQLAGASIPLRVTENSLSFASWIRKPSVLRHHCYRDDLYPFESWPTIEDDVDSHTECNSKSRSFACIVFFESGTYHLDINDCDHVIAVASGNSIFVASHFMTDPTDRTDVEGPVIRIAGNVGMAGISLLVLPTEMPHVRQLAHNLSVVPHIPFDGQEENNFADTSLHLRFTKWRRPYDDTSRGDIDEGLFYVESVISVHESGKWVCDLDVQAMLTFNTLHRWTPKCLCYLQGDSAPAISIDTWEELIDPPDGLGIVRAKNNWYARLAALILRLQTGFDITTFVIPSAATICSKCITAEYLLHTGELAGILIN